MLTFNTRALLDSKPGVKHNQVPGLLSISKGKSSVAPQETHGGVQAMGSAGASVCKDLWVWEHAGPVLAPP